ncbi:thiosulfate oxidation carrier protein SoxY [Paracandidimonas soli]|uniref:thiosulfate oxidation carrier protein SoxY n=1 Tax=Paracandidimonas soli TaxID=1917182 RepID=UPI003340B6A9
MTSFDASTTGRRFDRRRQLLTAGAAVGLGSSLLPATLRAQALQQLLEPATKAEVQAVIDDFLQGAKPLGQGLLLEMPVLADNPAAVPVKAVLEAPVTPEAYCEELIILAEGNPKPLACRFKFTPLAGTTEVAVRLRLIGTQSIRVLARMNDGRVLTARRDVAVTAGGCGM